MNNPFRKAITAASLALLTMGFAHADVYTEDFEQPFPAWESNWFGTKTDANNIYCAARNCALRGNNPDGLWLRGTSNSDIRIAFDNAFGSTLTSFSLDIAAYSSQTFLTAYDISGNQIFNQRVTRTAGAYSDPGVYENLTITSTNGISRFEFSIGSAGNTSIDNLRAVTATLQNDVPEPATIGLLGLGLLGIRAARRRSASR